MEEVGLFISMLPFRLVYIKDFSGSLFVFFTGKFLTLASEFKHGYILGNIFKQVDLVNGMYYLQHICSSHILNNFYYLYQQLYMLQ